MCDVRSGERKEERDFEAVGENSQDEELTFGGGKFLGRIQDEEMMKEKRREKKKKVQLTRAADASLFALCGVAVPCLSPSPHHCSSGPDLGALQAWLDLLWGAGPPSAPRSPLNSARSLIR